MDCLVYYPSPFAIIFAIISTILFYNASSCNVELSKDIYILLTNHALSQHFSEAAPLVQSLSTVPIPIIIIDPHTDEAKWGNAMANQHFDKTVFTPGTSFSHDVFATCDPNLFLQGIQIAQADGLWQGELSYARANHKNATGSFHLIPICKEDTHWIQVSIVDTTELKNYQKQLHKFHTMETIGGLSASAIHDLNNIFTTLFMGLRVLKRSVGEDDRQASSILQMLDSSTKRGADLLKQVSNFNRGIKPEYHQINVRKFLEEWENILSNSLPKTIETHVKINQDVWHIMGNAVQLHQVLLNLCTNAKDAIEGSAQAKLCVEASNKILPSDTLRPKGQYVQICVSDTGKGIPKELHTRIFEPFFTTKSARKGTGMGLATVLRIVKNHGGYIDIESEEGYTTSFRLLFPAIDPSSPL